VEGGDRSRRQNSRKNRKVKVVGGEMEHVELSGHVSDRLYHHHVTMRKYLFALVALGLLAPLAARAEDVDPEPAFMPRTMDVTLLNETHPEGGSCRMDKDATIIRVGPGATAGTTRVRYAAPQLSPGGCPFLTAFELTDAR
jgi:hypothetical protein